MALESSLKPRTLVKLRRSYSTPMGTMIESPRFGRVGYYPSWTDSVSQVTRVWVWWIGMTKNGDWVPIEYLSKATNPKPDQQLQLPLTRDTRSAGGRRDARLPSRRERNG